jgi:hypothetical protein
MPEPVHCNERMELARMIPRFQALPELLVFRCPIADTSRPSSSPPLKRDPISRLPRAKTSQRKASPKRGKRGHQLRSMKGKLIKIRCSCRSGSGR